MLSNFLFVLFICIKDPMIPIDDCYLMLFFRGRDDEILCEKYALGHSILGNIEDFSPVRY